MNIANALIPYIEGISSFEEACYIAINWFYTEVINNSFICKVCGEVISPEITVNEHGIFVEHNCNKNNVCQRCMKNG